MKQSLKENGGLPASILWTLAIVAGVSVANIYYIQPLLNMIRHELGISEFRTNLIAMVTQIGYAAGLLFITPLGDLYQRKKIILVNFTVLIFSLLTIALTRSFHLILIASFLTGVCSMIPQIFIPIAAQFSRPEHKGRNVGIVLSGLLTGILASRVVSGFIGELIGWREMYHIAAGMMFICAIVVLKVLPDIQTNFQGKYSGLMKSLLALVKEYPQLRIYSIRAALNFGSLLAMWSCLAFKMGQAPFFANSDVIGMLGLCGVAGALTASFVGKYVKRVGVRRFNFIGCGLILFAWLLFFVGENTFVGIIAGIIGALCYNRFKSTKLPDWLSFFSGKRCVAIVAGVVSIIVSAVLLFVWPVLFAGLVALGKGIAGMGALGAGIYAFFNRLLIPFGLHHALNNVFWFDTIGLGDLSHFWNGETSADVSWSLGMYMSGFFPCMMFGIPGAALAMIQSAKSNKKKVAIGLIASAAISAFVCGVTEPFEFAFMFLAPALYVVYALLYGIFTVITVALGFRAGFSFSAGLTDLIFSAPLPAAAKTWLIIPLGIAAFIVFYVVFRFAIVKFDLKTPGREDDDDDETKVVLANDDFTTVAKIVLEGVGGKDNVESIDNCITRLRLVIKDYTKVDEKKIKSAGVAGVVRPSQKDVQVIIGTKVQFVADEFKKLCK